MRVTMTGRFLKTEHIWFEECTTNLASKSDRIFIWGNKTPIKGGEMKKQYSLVSNLECDPETFKLAKTVKNEINRSKKENVEVRFFTSEELAENPAVIVAFNEMYHAMYEAKGIGNQWLDKTFIDAYVRVGAYVVSVAYIEGEPAVYHSYVVDEENVRLFQSCSDFRAEDKEKRNAIGRANKYLHWEDMLFFKGKGVKRYDWGGVMSLEEPNGIDKFKMSFGGEPVEYYNIGINNTLKAKMAKWIVKFKKKGRK